MPGTEEGWKYVEITQRIHNGPDCYPWRPWFAWRPVKTISGQRVWLRRIYKRRFGAVWGTGFHMEPKVEFGDILDILKDDLR